MTSNMKIEDRIAEKLKSEEFGKWFGEEDLHDLVKEGIERAFFKPRTVQDGYTTKVIQPAIVEAASQHLKTVIAAEAKIILQKRFEEDPELLASTFAKIAEKATADIILDVLKGAIQNSFTGLRFDIETGIRNSLGIRS